MGGAVERRGWNGSGINENHGARITRSGEERDRERNRERDSWNGGYTVQPWAEQHGDKKSSHGAVWPDRKRNGKIFIIIPGQCQAGFAL